MSKLPWLMWLLLAACKDGGVETGGPDEPYVELVPWSAGPLSYCADVQALHDGQFLVGCPTFATSTAPGAGALIVLDPLEQEQLLANATAGIWPDAAWHIAGNRLAVTDATMAEAVGFGAFNIGTMEGRGWVSSIPRDSWASIVDVQHYTAISPTGHALFGAAWTVFDGSFVTSTAGFDGSSWQPPALFEVSASSVVPLSVNATPICGSNATCATELLARDESICWAGNGGFVFCYDKGMDAIEARRVGIDGLVDVDPAQAIVVPGDITRLRPLGPSGFFLGHEDGCGVEYRDGATRTWGESEGCGYTAALGELGDGSPYQAVGLRGVLHVEIEGGSWDGTVLEAALDGVSDCRPVIAAAGSELIIVCETTEHGFYARVVEP